MKSHDKFWWMLITVSPLYAPVVPALVLCQQYGMLPGNRFLLGYFIGFLGGMWFMWRIKQAKAEATK